MCTHSSHPAAALCFIIPPHILEHLAANASDAQMRKNAVRSLQLAAQLRGMREGFAQLASAGLGTPTRQRTIYNAREKTRLPGVVERTEGQAAGPDLACNEAYDGSGATYDFYKDVLNRLSIDNHGMRLDSTVHYSHGYDNAFWNGRQMVYGDGDGVLFDRFTKCLDVIGHELTHGVTQYSAQLEYQDQSGALNESMSDVFGSIIKQYHLKQSAEQADWLIGAGLLIPKAGTNRAALRSMKAPGTAYDDPELGKDPQPAHMKDYYHGSDDNGGVHINSGIPNHAFYLVASKLGGHSWEVAGKIWYETLTTRLHANSVFADAAAASRDVAKHYPGNAAKAVDEAWKAVGL
jgi:Zn-dependent metalloprotease